MIDIKSPSFEVKSPSIQQSNVILCNSPAAPTSPVSLELNEKTAFQIIALNAQNKNKDFWELLHHAFLLVDAKIPYELEPKLKKIKY